MSIILDKPKFVLFSITCMGVLLVLYILLCFNSLRVY